MDNPKIVNGQEIDEGEECNRLAPWNPEPDPYDIWIDNMLLGLHGSMERELGRWN